jgi:spore coat protein U-like protein
MKHTFIKTSIKVALAATSVMGMVVDGYAGSSTGNLDVSATVVNPCTITASAMAFGNYDTSAQTSSDLDINGTVGIQCAVGTNPTVALGAGGNYAGGNRRMTGGGGEYLNYNLYTGATRNTEWNMANTRAYSGTGLPDTITVYGRVFQGQTPSDDTYADTVVVTALF